MIPWYIRYPVCRPHPYAAAVPGDRFDPRSILSEEAAIFRLMCVPLENLETLVFYECTHCRGGGLPSFDPSSGNIPEDTLDLMHQHVELCEHFHPSKKSNV